MQTYTHFLVALAASRPLCQKWKQPSSVPQPQRSAFWLGSVLPDLPLIAITIVCFVIDLIQGSANNYTSQLFDTWYFESKAVMSAYNLFHAPLSCLMFLSVFYLAWRWLRVWGSAWWFWVISNALFHALCDIPVHHNDGPLLLFPFNFTVRFNSPVSYYDPDYYGIPFLIVEHSVVIVLLGREVYLCCQRRRERLRQQATEEQDVSNTDDDDNIKASVVEAV